MREAALRRLVGRVRQGRLSRRDFVARMVASGIAAPLVCGGFAVIPLVHRPAVTGMNRKLVAPQSGWNNALASLAHWYREA